MSPSTRSRLILAAVSAANFAIVLLLPPFDYVSVERASVPTFDGFHPFFAVPPNRAINGDFLTLELIVVATNACIGWLLLRDGAALPTRRSTRAQRVVLLLVAANLLTALLFPPFENYQSISKAILPSFDGFYFLFGDRSGQQIVAPILYIEVFLVLINGLLLWLMLGRQRRETPTPADIRQLAEELKRATKGRDSRQKPGK